MTLTSPPARERVPIRTISATIGLVLGTALLLLFVMHVHRVLTWIVIAAFFAVALYPAVGLVQHRLVAKRSLATLVVFLLGVLIVGGVGIAFAVPLVKEGATFADHLPQLIADARAGRGPVGDFLERTNALDYVQRNQERIRELASGLTAPAAGVLRGVATGVVALVTIVVLSYLMVLQGPKLTEGLLNTLPTAHQERVRRLGSDCARSVTGYVFGNVLISVICGLMTYVTLKILGIPFAGLLALFVAIADLIPLVGASLGALVASLAGFIHSVPAGIALIVFFILYQQLENHLLQPVILSRTVKLNPLTVLIAILVFVELAGILGALLAIPVAGMVQVIVRDVWDHRRGRPNPEPTTREDERLPSQAFGIEG